MRFDARHVILMHLARLGRRVPDRGGGDHLVQDAAELEAAEHGSDRHEVSIDHADQFGERARLADHAQAAQSMQSIHAARRTGQLLSCCRSTSMELELDSVGRF